MDKRYFGILTEIGIAQLANATVLDQKVNITKMVVGDGNGAYCVPTPTQTSLINEVHRVNVTKVEVDSESANMINITAVLPSNVGGFTIREIGAVTEDGLLIAISNTPEIEKVSITNGVSAEIEISMQIIISATEAIELKVDPTVILATKADIEKHNKDPKAHIGHFENTEIHCSIEEKERWNNADQLSKSNKVEIDLLKLGQESHDSRLKRLEDSLFNDIIGNPYLITFADLEGIILTKGIWNKKMKRLEA